MPAPRNAPSTTRSIVSAAPRRAGTAPRNAVTPPESPRKDCLLSNLFSSFRDASAKRRETGRRYFMNRQNTLWLAGAGLASWLAYRVYRASTAYSFAGKTVVITGGTRGLGLVMARQLA